MVAGRRKNNPLGLEPRVYASHGQFFYAHRNGGKWEPLGTDVEKANARARLYNDTQGRYGTIVYWLDMWIVALEQRVANKTLSARTLEDYTADVELLKVYFAAPMLPTDVIPKHIQDYIDIGEANGRPVRANREKSTFSSFMSWLIREGHCDGLVVNPCLRASGIKRNTETKRDRYVEHVDYQDVFVEAPPQVQAMMELTYRTLQRPESDILFWTAANVTWKDGKRIIRNEQNKVQGTTGKVVDIELSPDLDRLVSRLIGEVPKIGRPLIHTSKGKGKRQPGQGYTYDGISSMLRRAIEKANIKRRAAGQPLIESFGFRDLKGKGATDMWRAGVPIEVIQHLCGHETKETTEIYVKQRWRETATPNMVEMIAKPA